MATVAPVTTARRDSERGEQVQRVLFNLSEVSWALGISRTEVERHIATGALASVKIGRRRLVSAGQLAAYVAQLERGAL